MDEPSTFELPDGRKLAYAEYGDPTGRPVFAFHGVPGSRIMWSLFDDAAREQGIQLVAPDRPGFGRSDFQPGRRLTDWPDDVATLADHLDVEEFGLLGFSAGCPHAAACVHAIPDRLSGAVFASGVAPPSVSERQEPFNHGILTALQYVPGFSLGAFGAAAWLATHSRSTFRGTLVGAAAAPDRDLFDDPAGDVLVDDAAEAFNGGSRGPAHDLPMVGNDWGFDASEIGLPVALWHGRADETVDIDLARAFADRLPDADLTVTDEAHYSTLVTNREPILAAVAGQ